MGLISMQEIKGSTVPRSIRGKNGGYVETLNPPHHRIPVTGWVFLRKKE